MNATFWQQDKEILRLKVHVAPNAKKTEIVGIHGDALKIRLASLPIEGKANDALIKFIAEKLGIKKAQIKITSGQTSRQKTLEISGDFLPLSPEILCKKQTDS